MDIIDAGLQNCTFIIMPSLSIEVIATLSYMSKGWVLVYNLYTR